VRQLIRGESGNPRLRLAVAAFTAVAAFVALSGPFAPAAFANPNCTITQSHSIEGVTPSAIDFVNDSGVRVDVYWLEKTGISDQITHLYDGRAEGYVWKAIDFLYPAYFLPAGVYYDPWPVIRKPWGVAPSLHRPEHRPSPKQRS